MRSQHSYTFALFTFVAYLSAPGSIDADTVRVPSDYGTIQAGIDAAKMGDTVLVAAGTYVGSDNRDLDFGTKTVVLASEEGPWHTVIDCESAGRAFQFHGSDMPRPRVVGFTLLAGNAEDGGAVLCTGASQPTFQNCRLIGNSADHTGGAVHAGDRARPAFENCSILGNQAPRGGGFSLLDDAALRLDNSVVARNRAQEGGAAAWIDGNAQATWNHSTVAQNWTPERAAIVVEGESTAHIRNSVLWDRKCAPVDDPHERTTVAFSNVRGGWDGPGNIDERPSFTSRWGLTHLLESGSPGVDAGDPASGTDGLRGSEGVGGTAAYVDMGAYGGPGGRGWVRHAPKAAPTVFPAGADGDTIRVPGDYPTIQQALNNAQDGDIIEIQEGSYSEFLTVDESNLKLIGVGGTVNITGSGTMPVVKLDGVENFFMKQLSLSNGRTGIEVINSAGTITMEDLNLSGIGEDGFTFDAITNLDVTLKNVDLSVEKLFDIANQVELPTLDGGGFLSISGGRWTGGDNGFSIANFGLTGFLDIEEQSLVDLNETGIKLTGKVEGFMSLSSVDFQSVQDILTASQVGGTFLYQTGEIRQIRGRFCELEELKIGAEFSLYDLDATSIKNFVSITQLKGELNLKDSKIQDADRLFEVNLLDVEAKLSLEHVDMVRITDGIIISELKGGLSFKEVRGVDLNTFVDTRNSSLGAEFEMSYSEIIHNRRDWGFKLGGSADFNFDHNTWKGSAFLQYNPDPFTNARLTFDYDEIDGDGNSTVLFELNVSNDDEAARGRSFIAFQNSTFKDSRATAIAAYGGMILDVKNCQFIDTYNAIYASDVDTLSVSRSQFVRADFGIQLWNGGDLIVSECDLVQTEYTAIYWSMYNAQSSMSCHDSHFSGSGENGIYVFGFAEDEGADDCRFNAQFNSWGNSTGPLDWSQDWYDCNDYNPSGLGDVVSDQIGYRPWDSTGGLAVLLTEYQPNYAPGDPFGFTINVENRDPRATALTRGVFWAKSPPNLDYTSVLYNGRPFEIEPGQPLRYPFSMKIPDGAPLGDYSAGITIYDGDTELDTYGFDFEMVD